jgi:hypothetical protein
MGGVGNPFLKLSIWLAALVQLLVLAFDSIWMLLSANMKNGLLGLGAT